MSDCDRPCNFTPISPFETTHNLYSRVRMKKKKPTSTSQMPKISSETTACLNRTYNAHTRERKREFAKKKKRLSNTPRFFQACVLKIFPSPFPISRLSWFWLSAAIFSKLNCFALLVDFSLYWRNVSVDSNEKEEETARRSVWSINHLVLNVTLIP